MSGNGGPNTPYIADLNLGTGDDDSCAQVMNCVGSNLGDALTYDDGEHDIYVNISSDTANMTEYGSDRGIYTPPTVVTAGTATTVTGLGLPEDPYVINTAPEVGDTAIQAGDGVTITGSGITADPYIVSATGPSYGVGQNVDTLEMTVSGRIQAPIALAATTYVTGEDGDVTDNGDGTLTINRPGAYFLSVTPRFQASARAYAAVYAYVQAGPSGSAQAWGGMSVPVSPEGRTAYSLGYAINATVNVTTPMIVSLGVSKSTYTVTARLVWAEYVIQRMGPALDLPSTVGAPPPMLPVEEAVDM